MDLLHRLRSDTVSTTPQFVCFAESLTISLGWFGAVGKVVGVVCGCALFRSLYAAIVPREDPSFRTTVVHLYAVLYWSAT